MRDVQTYDVRPVVCIRGSTEALRANMASDMSRRVKPYRTASQQSAKRLLAPPPVSGKAGGNAGVAGVPEPSLGPPGLVRAPSGEG